MDYTGLIRKRSEYKYSANIGFDLNNEKKLEDFIPNISSIEILNEYLHDTIDNNKNVHSRILYGSYGTGKSHLLTILCAILGHINTNVKGFKTLLDAIKKYDDDLANYIEEYVCRGKPYLIVPVNSSFSEFDNCILYSLKKELDAKGIKCCFKNFFYEAIELIEKWKSQEGSNEILQRVCRELEIDLEELITSLENFEVGSENKFNNIFQQITYGASFNSEPGNLITNLEYANELIKEKYRGIVFIFDEFGRYIEDMSDNIKVKSIQDLAEYCDHSSYNNFLFLVSHKRLSLYTNNMQKDISDEWKKIEGRFKTTSINIKYDQCLSLITHIIPKSERWGEFKKRFNDKLNNIYKQAWDFKGFLLTVDKENPFEGVYPLHPITLYALDKLSRKVAQNERTFFTYLVSDEENSLTMKLKQMSIEEFHFIGLDGIYDYFETNIATIKSDDIHTVYKKYQSAINKLGNQEKYQLEVCILKVLAIIQIISDPTVLAANRKMILQVIDAEDQLIDAAIDKLLDLKIIKYMRQYSNYDFLDGSIYDIEAMIDENQATINDEMAIATLNDEFTNFVVYPYEYNLTYHMNRIFIPIFTLKSELEKKSFTKKITNFYDGIIAFVVDKEINEKDYLRISKSLERTILLVNLEAKKILQEVKRYIAIKYLYTQRNILKEDDPTVEREIELYLEEQKEVVTIIVNYWRELKGRNSITYCDGIKMNIKSDIELTNVAAKLMFESYPDTIIINNDLINKNTLSSAMKLARKNVLASIIEMDNILERFSKLSPEHTIIRSVLTKNGFDTGEVNDRLNEFPNRAGKVTGEPVKKVISRFLKKCEKAQTSINDLYRELKKEPFGLRDGYISILLAFALKKYKNVSLYFHDIEKDYCADELLNAIEHANDYKLYVYSWSDEQNKYIDGLEYLFSEFIVRKNNNRLKELFMAMNRHFTTVSKGARTTEKFVSEKTKLYREILNLSYRDYNKFFFETLLELNTNTQELIIEINNIIEELKNVTVLQTVEIERVIRKAIKINKSERLAVELKKKYENDWQRKNYKVVDYSTNAFLTYLHTMETCLDDQKIVGDIARTISGFEIAYWNDSMIVEFEEKLNKVIKYLENQDIKNEVGANEIKVIIQLNGKDTKMKQFENQELNVNSQIMFNKLKATLNNFGQSISYEEKIQVITKLLGEIM